MREWKNLILLAVLLTTWGEANAVADSPSSGLRDFVTAVYVHGVPYERARAFGPEAIEELAGMLEDPELESSWTNVVATLGYIGDAQAVEPLLAFVERQEGEVSVHVFRAVLSVATALGHVAHHGDETSLSILTSWTQASHWKSAGLGMSYARYHGDALGEVIGRMAVQALGISGRPEARQVLQEMVESDSLNPDWVDNVTEAIGIHQKVRDLGVKSLFSR